MADIPGTESIEEIDARIAIVRENLRDLIEQAAAYSGAADDELCRDASPSNKRSSIA